MNGDLHLSDGVMGHSINLQIGAGTVNVVESLHHSGNAIVAFTGAGVLNVQDDYEYTGGAFAAGTGNVVYNGSGNQQIAPVDYYNLTINKPTGIATIDSVVHVGHDLQVTSGQLDFNKALHVAGDVTIAAAASVHNSGSFYVGGNWNRTGTYTSNGASIYFNGAGTQTISGSTFNNLIIDKPVTIAQLAGNVIINSDVTVKSGTFDVHTFTCDRSVAGGKATLEASGTIVIESNSAQPVCYL